MPRLSAGLLLFRRIHQTIEVFLVHPGGPFWAKKDKGAWSIPKGEYTPAEAPLPAAKREFLEETGTAINGRFLSLGRIQQAGRKIVTAWAIEGDLDPASLKSNLFEMEWPPKSGRMSAFPEVDKGSWFSPEAAREKITKSQATFVDRLIELLEAENTRGIVHQNLPPN